MKKSSPICLFKCHRLSMLLTSCGAILLPSLVFSLPPEPEIGKRWVLNPSLSDEFNGRSLDRSKWHDFVINWKGRAPAMFYNEDDITHPENKGLKVVSVVDGNLKIRNQKLNKPEVINGTHYTITGGAIQSNRESAYHGYYEVRFKASRINMSTTFWLSSSGAPMPADNNLGIDCPDDSWSQELDIVETVGGTLDAPWAIAFRTKQQYNTHARYRPCSFVPDRKEIFYSKGANQAEGNAELPANNSLPEGQEVWQGFNTFAAWWKNDREVDFYLNDNFSGHVDFSTALFNDPFSRPMRMQMVTETYNWAKPYPTDGQLKNNSINTSYYDWVRSYLLIGVNDDPPSQENGLLSNFGFKTGRIDWSGTPRKVVNENTNGDTVSAQVVRRDSQSTIFVSNIKIKSLVLEGSKLNIDYVYKTEVDGVIKIILSQGNNIQSEKTYVKAGYGHQLYSIDLSSYKLFNTPSLKVELQMTQIKNAQISTSSGAVKVSR